MECDLHALAKEAHEAHERRFEAAECVAQGAQRESLGSQGELVNDLPDVELVGGACGDNVAAPSTTEQHARLDTAAKRAPERAWMGRQSMEAVSDNDVGDRPSARNARVHRRRKAQRQAAVEQEPVEGIFASASKPPKAHTAKHA